VVDPEVGGDGEAKGENVGLAVPGEGDAEEEDGEGDDDPAEEFCFQILEIADLQPSGEGGLGDEELVEAEGDDGEDGGHEEDVHDLDGCRHHVFHGFEAELECENGEVKGCKDEGDRKDEAVHEQGGGDQGRAEHAEEKEPPARTCDGVHEKAAGIIRPAEILRLWRFILRGHRGWVWRMWYKMRIAPIDHSAQGRNAHIVGG
jgi:hypothetical protein